jgi:plastocyanin
MEEKMKRMGLLLGLAGCLMATPAALADHFMVGVENFTFNPAELTIFTGDSVGWRNHQGFHSTTSDDGLWDFGAAAAPWGFPVTFTVAGDYMYYCKIHGASGGVGMSGVIHVFDIGD